MWLLIEIATGLVRGYQEQEIPADGYDPAVFEVKEWAGDPPDLDGPDPTLADLDYQVFVNSRVDFDALEDKATNEIAWLEENISLIDTMTVEELRGVAKRLCQENLEQIKAWRYVIRRLT